MTITIVIINPQTGNGAGMDGPENLRILKKSQLKVDIGLWRQIVEFSATGVGS